MKNPLITNLEGDKLIISFEKIKLQKDKERVQAKPIYRGSLKELLELRGIFL